MDKVVHFEIPAENVSRAKKFYSEIFGWQIDKVPAEDMEYYMVKTVGTDEKNMPLEAGAINGGLMKRTGKTETPVLVINVPSVDDYLKKIKKAGGKTVMEKQKVMGVGLYARVLDTEGNVIGIWQDIKGMAHEKGK